MLQRIKTAYKSDVILKVEWLVMACIALVMFMAFYFVDLESLTIWTTDLLDAVCDGRPFEVYKYGIENAHGAEHEAIGGNIFVLIPWAIWNVPIWILQRFFHLEIVEHSTMLLWSKMFLVVMLAMTVLLAYKMVRLMEIEHSDAMWIVLLTLTYPYTYLGVYYAGQSDIICTCFFAMAIYMLLKGKNNLFYIFSTCAIAIKPFYLLSYVAIILLLEKKIYKIFLKLLAGVGLTLFLGVIFSEAPLYKESMEAGPTQKLLENMFGHGYDSFFSKASYLTLFLVLIYFVAYLTKVKEEQKNRYIVYAIVVPLLVYFMFSGFEFYRMLILSPFLFIMFFQNKSMFRINMLINMVINLCSLLVISGRSKYMLATEYMHGTTITEIFGTTKASERVWNTLPEFWVGQMEYFPIYMKGVAGVFGGGILLLIIINYPRFRKQFEVETEKCERWILWGNMFLIIPFLLLAFLCYYTV